MTRAQVRPGDETGPQRSPRRSDRATVTAQRRRIGNPWCGCQVPGIHEPGCILRDPIPPQRCSRDYACKTQPMSVLERAGHCPCAEATTAVEGVVA